MSLFDMGIKMGLHILFLIFYNKINRTYRSIGGEGGIRTRVPSFPDHPISSRRRYDRFGTSPHPAISILYRHPEAQLYADSLAATRMMFSPPRNH